MIKQRSLAMAIILSIVTFGIYGIIFMYGWNEDTNKVCAADGKPALNYILVLILSAVTGGIYSIYWLYKQQNRLYLIGCEKADGRVKSAGTVLIWAILGSFIIVGPFVALYYMINGLNIMAEVYNNEVSNGTAM